MSDAKVDTLSVAVQETRVRLPVPSAISTPAPLNRVHTAHFPMQRVGLEASFGLVLLEVGH